MQTDLRLWVITGVIGILGSLVIFRRRRKRAIKQVDKTMFEVPKQGLDLDFSVDPLLDEEPKLAETKTEKFEPLSVISLTIMARRRVALATVAPKGFKGSAVFSALRGARLRFAENGIFERVLGEEEQLLFKVVSVTEPGVFDESSMNTQYYAGLLLFITIPGPRDPLFAFDNMLSTAKQVTRILGGELCDGERQVLTKDRIEALRERISLQLEQQEALCQG